MNGGPLQTPEWIIKTCKPGSKTDSKPFTYDGIIALPEHYVVFHDGVFYDSGDGSYLKKILGSIPAFKKI